MDVSIRHSSISTAPRDPPSPPLPSLPSSPLGAPQHLNLCLEPGAGLDQDREKREVLGWGGGGGALGSWVLLTNAGVAQGILLTEAFVEGSD